MLPGGEDIGDAAEATATVHGYEQLHAIHVRLQNQGTGGPSSRYEVESILTPAPDVAVALVRRTAIDSDGRPRRA